MSSSDHEMRIPMINQGLSIPELIKIVKHTFLECEFNEVQDILMDREKKMLTEVENLKRDCDLIKEEARLLERTQSLSELEKLKLEEKLHRSRGKCEELNERVNELKNKNFESERLVKVYEEKLRCLNTRVLKLGDENEGLRTESLAANQTLEELRRKQVEADRVVEELKRQNLEAAQTVDELRVKKMESDKAAELYKNRLENLEVRVMKVEAAFADMLNVKVGDLADIGDNMGKSAAAAAEGQNVDLPDFLKGGEDSLGNGSTDADAEDVVVIAPKVHSTSNPIGRGEIGLSKGIFSP